VPELPPQVAVPEPLLAKEAVAVTEAMIAEITRVFIVSPFKTLFSSL
jgi:hypothetical protein